MGVPLVVGWRFAKTQCNGFMSRASLVWHAWLRRGVGGTLNRGHGWLIGELFGGAVSSYAVAGPEQG